MGNSKIPLINIETKYTIPARSKEILQIKINKTKLSEEINDNIKIVDNVYLRYVIVKNESKNKINRNKFKQCRRYLFTTQTKSKTI